MKKQIIELKQVINQLNEQKQLVVNGNDEGTEVHYVTKTGIALYSLSQVEEMSKINKNKLAYNLTKLGVFPFSTDGSTNLFLSYDIAEMLDYILMEYQLQYLKENRFSKPIIAQ